MSDELKNNEVDSNEIENNESLKGNTYIDEKIKEKTDAKTEENIDEAEQLAKEKFGKSTKILMIAFAAIVVIIIICFALFHKKSHVKLGEYKGLTYTPVDTTVSDTEVNEAIQSVIDNKTRYEKLDDRNGTEVKIGDIVNCSYKAVLNSELIEEGTGNFNIGSNEFTDFENALTGKVIGDTVNITAVIPDNYTGAEKLSEIQGSEVEFEVTINFVSEKKIPEITDEFVSEVTYGECKSAADYNSYIRKQLEEKKQDEVNSKIASELVDKVIVNSEFYDIDEMVQEYYDTMYSTYVSAAANYELDMAEYIQQFYSRDLKDFQTELREVVVDLVKEQIVLKEIADKEKLKVSKEKYNEYMKQYLKDYQYTDEAKFLENYGEDSVKESMLYDYTIDFLIENAKPAK